jgi:glutaredoxin-related protein
MIDFIKAIGECSSKYFFDNLNISVSQATLKRILSTLKSNTFGQGKSTKYQLSPAFELRDCAEIP